MSALAPAFVLCTGLNGLGACRSLGIAGIPVTAVFTNRGDPAWRSRHVRRRLLAPPDGSDADWQAFLLNHARHSVVIPTADAGVALLSRLRGKLPTDVRLVTPPAAVGEVMVDKRRELECMSSIDSCIPRSVTRLPPTADDLLRRLQPPVIIKPVLFSDTPIIGAKNLIAHDAGALRAAYARIKGREDRFIAQEIVPGDDSRLWVCNATFDQQHHLVAAFTFQRLRTLPAHFGVTSSAVSRRNPAVIERVATIGRKLGYVGPAMFEFKQHPESLQYLYIEINPRLGMCNWFDTRCGVNNALMAYTVALSSGPIETLAPQHEGLVFLDLFSDVYSRLADGETLGGVLGAYFQHLKARRVAAYWSFSDPAPGLVALTRNSRNAVRITSGLLRGRQKHVRNPEEPRP